MPKQTKIVHMPWLAAGVSLIRQFTRRIWLDRVTVYAAQASFFIIISAVPLISMLANILHLVLPSAAEENILAFFVGSVPDTVLQMAAQLFSEVASASPVPVLSVSAVMIWWSAAKGVGAVREGIQTVYEAPRVRGYFRKMFRSAVYTIIFVFLIIAVIGVLLFGERLLYLFQTRLRLTLPILDTLLSFKTPFFLVFLTLVFSVLYYAVARRSHLVSHRFFSHVPGAVFAALGWVGFSFAYSYYMNHASRPQMIYGGLTALCLIMLWLYFCMIILLWGAEINKMFFAKK